MSSSSLDSGKLLSALLKRRKDCSLASSFRSGLLAEHGKRIPIGTCLPENEVKRAEDLLGFRLPELLREIYLNVANGGFGPGYGLIPLLPPGDRSEGSVVGRYRTNRDETSEEYPTLKWPEGLIHLAHWGCAIYSCVECLQPPFAVLRLDPNAAEEDANYAPDLVAAVRRESESLEAWFTDWTNDKLRFEL